MLTALKGLKVKVREVAKHFRIATMRRLVEVEKTYPVGAVPLASLSYLNSLQSCFREAYDSEKNCVVESPVGTGMTVVAYLTVQRAFEKGERIILTVPRRALVKACAEILKQGRRRNEKKA
jgi:replicative superfamily II helicase